MSRVVYSDTKATADQETLRVVHQVRLVENAEEGCGVNVLPNGTYGFTYSPGLPNAPLFAVRRYRSFETHKLASGDVFVIGFVTREAAAALSSTLTDVTVQLQPEPEGSADVLVTYLWKLRGRLRRRGGQAAPPAEVPA